MYMFTVLRISSLVSRVGPAMKINNNNNTCLIFYIHFETIMIPYYIYLYTYNMCVCVCVLCETLQRKNVYNNTIILTTYCTVILCIMYENGAAVKCGDQDSRALRSSHPAKDGGKGCRIRDRRGETIYYIIIVIIITLEECDLIFFATIKMKIIVLLSKGGVWGRQCVCTIYIIPYC